MNILGYQDQDLLCKMRRFLPFSVEFANSTDRIENVTVIWDLIIF